jgi:hypothetical protein
MDVSYAWICVPGKFTTKFSPTLSSGTTFHIRPVQKNALLNSISKHIHTQSQTVDLLNTRLATQGLLCE